MPVWASYRGAAAASASARPDQSASPIGPNTRHDNPPARRPGLGSDHRALTVRAARPPSRADQHHPGRRGLPTTALRGGGWPGDLLRRLHAARGRAAEPAPSTPGRAALDRDRGARRRRPRAAVAEGWTPARGAVRPVSYTHLTLPTIYSV